MGPGKRFFVLSTLIAGACGLAVPCGAAATAENSGGLNGKWQWEATCERGDFHGVMEFVQNGSTFVGQFLETNFWDKGTISNGVIQGNHISFDRCLWGTDWTRAFAVVNYEQGVVPFLKTDRLSDSERATLMGGACAKAYGWSPKKS